MTNLRREFRSQLTRGAWQYAIVESTAMGKATVRLAQGGARVTNCQILGADVEVGEKVVLDYSAEGAPTVRPYTIKGNEIPEEPPLQDFPEPDKESWVYAKYTMSDEAVENYGGCRTYLTDAPAGYNYALEPGFAYGSYSGQYRYQSNFSNAIPFDEAIVDNIGIISSTGITYQYPGNPYRLGYFSPPPGVYMVSITFALDITTNDLTHFGGGANLVLGMGGLTVGFNASNNIHVPKREHHAIYHNTICGKYEGVYWWDSQSTYTNFIRWWGILDGAGANVYPDEWYLPPDRERMTYLKVAKVPGAYPIAEFYKLADIGKRQSCIPQWYWEHYDYPDG